MPPKVKARLSEIEGNYYLELPNAKPRLIEHDEIRQFILSYQDPQYFFIGSAHLTTRPKGEILAKVFESGSLIITSPQFLSNLFSPPINYITVAEYAALHGRKEKIITRLCREGRIPGAIQRSYRWLIPADAPYPERMSKKNP